MIFNFSQIWNIYQTYLNLILYKHTWIVNEANGFVIRSSHVAMDPRPDVQSVTFIPSTCTAKFKQTLFKKRTILETEPLQTSSLSVNVLGCYVCLYPLDRSRKTWSSYFDNFIMHHCLRSWYNESSKSEVLFCIEGLSSSFANRKELLGVFSIHNF